MVNEIINEALALVQYNAPVKSGVLRDSFHVINYGNGTYGIRTTIPYMVYTEAEWLNRGGRINPNEAWFKNVALLIAEMIAFRLGGVLNVGT